MEKGRFMKILEDYVGDYAKHPMFSHYAGMMYNAVDRDDLTEKEANLYAQVFGCGFMYGKTRGSDECIRRLSERAKNDGD